MKILMTGLLPSDPDRNDGGVVSVIRNLLDGFQHTPDVEICHVSFNKETDRPVLQQIAPNIRLRFLPFRSRIDLVDYALNRRTLDNIIREESPDLIHIQEITPQVLRFLHLDRNRLVVTQHGIMRTEIRHLRTPGPLLKGLFKSGIERFILPWFRNVIFISAYNRAVHRGHPVNSEIIFNPAGRMFFESQLPEGDPCSWMMVAAFSRIKNAELLLRVLHRFRQDGIRCTLNLVGGFKTKSYERFIHRMIRSLGLQDQVKSHGWCSPTEVLQHMRSSAVCILPSRKESLPVAVAEAMAAGRVVVASDVGAVSEMFLDGDSGFLFPSEDADALHSILSRLLEDHGLRRRVAERARIVALHRFHPDIIAARTLRFYQQVAKSRTETAPA